MKRSLAFGLLPAALLGLLLGCGQQPRQEAKNDPVAAPPENKDGLEGSPGAGGEPDPARGEVDRTKKATGDAAEPRDNLTGAKTDPSTSPVPGIIPTTSVNPVAPTVPPLGPGGTAAGGITTVNGPVPPGLGAIPGGGRPAGKGKSGGNYGPAAGSGSSTSPVPADGRPGIPAPNLAPPAREPAAKVPPRGDGGDAKPDPKQAVGAGDVPSNTEQYGVYRENEFRSPLVAALSTFSADVNTASYSNVRRMLMTGVMPPKDSIFLAEFVNYFPYHYAAPKGEDPIEYNMEMGPCPWNRKHHLVRIGVQAQKIEPDKMPARNLVFLMDTSGSMSPPNRLPLAKQAINLVIDQLGEKDRVSIVTYAGDSRIALGPTKGSEKERIKEVMTNLRAEGSTNGEGGIKNAYKLARDSFIDGGVNRVILCTDGDFNVGITGKGELVRMIEDQRRSKVFLTILGFGMGNYKDDTLKELANHGNGHHAYIDTIDEAKKLFVEQGGALVCVAKDVKFQVDFNPAKVAAYRLVGYENRMLKDEDFKNDAKDAGDMSGGHQVTVLYEIVPVGVPIELPGVDKSKYTIPTQIDPKAADEWLTVKMRYKHPEADVSKELAKSLPGKALGAELSDDFRFAAASASFGMILRESQFRGAMTYAGVLEEAQGCLGKDPGGHRKEFLELVKKAKEMSAPKPASPEAPREGN